MSAVSKILLGGAGLAALAAAAPAAAQYYPPNYGYGYPGYGSGGGNVLGTILDTILGGRSYGHSDRSMVEQCVCAVEYRINTRGFDNEGGRYRQYGYGYGYDQGYRNYQGARVISVTDVSRRSNGGLRIRGLASSGQGAGAYGYGYGNQGYGYDNYGYGQYGYQQTADARFSCTTDRYGRITDIDADRYSGGYYPYRRY